MSGIRGSVIAMLAMFSIGSLAPAPVEAQATIRRAQPGFNLFSAQQDVEIGRQSAAEAEKQLPLLHNAVVDAYLGRIVQRLAAVAPGAKFPYTVKAVNAADINAFALPGGPMYVYRGLIAATRNEAELAGVIAHEMAHVALRHGTSQASNAYLAKGGLSILGGLLGKSRSSSALAAIGGVGLNTVFLKFSRKDELEADATGAEMMARAGYDPLAMATMFEMLRAQQGRDPSKLEQFFSDHPATADREARIRQLAASLPKARVAPVGNLATIQASLGQASPASTSVLGRLDVPGDTLMTTTNPVVALNLPAPSSKLRRYTSPTGAFAISYPVNWEVAPSAGLAVAMAPAGGVVESADGLEHMLYGVIVNHYAPFGARTTDATPRTSYVPIETARRRTGTLEEATDDLINTILRTNTYLRAEAGSARPETIAGARGYSAVLTGTSPLTGQPEQVMVFTRALPDGHVVYALAIAPAKDAGVMDPTIVRMMRTLTVNDQAVHRAESPRVARRNATTVP